LASSWASIMPASTFFYVFCLSFWDFMLHDILSACVLIAIGLVAGYFILVLASWTIAKISVALVCKGKPIPEGKFATDYSSPEWRDFSMRHVSKKFSMWLFQHHVPHSLYRKYVGSFIKIGKHVELPEYVAMEWAEIGDNTVFARQTVFASHVIDGKVMILKHSKIGKNCIVDADDETKRVVIMPSVTIEDDVIIKPGSYVSKDSVLKSGGIYKGDTFLERVGNVSDLSKAELDAYRKEVRKKRELKSRMIEDWSAFKSGWPRFIVFLANVVGYTCALALVCLFLLLMTPWLVTILGVFGHLISIVLLPLLLFLAYGFYVYFPLIIIFKGVKHYGKNIPKLADDPKSQEVIDDPALIESWRKCKWLKWRAIDRVNQSLFLDTSMIIYQHIGKNDVAFKTVLYVSKLDTDNVTIGDNTILSFGCHIYAYKLENGAHPRLILKKTSVGRNCIIGSSIIEAGAKIGDDVVLGYHTGVPEDAILESGKTYAGNPAIEFNKFLELRRQLKDSSQKS